MSGTIRRWQRGDVGRILLVAVLTFQQPASTAVIVVDGGCALADAISAANTDSVVGGCSAGSGADEIQLTGDVNLTSALPGIVSDITIEGGDFTVARDGAAPEFGIFSVTSGSFALSHMTVANGRAFEGGAIYVSDGPVTITHSTLSGNEADFGGAVFVYNSGGVLSITNSTLMGNSASRGGAIYTSWYTESTMSGSTVSGNSATVRGGGFYVSFGGEVDVTNSTVSGNTAAVGGGVYTAVYGHVRLLNSTVSGNSGTNLYAGFKAFLNSIYIDRSIVAYPASGSNCSNYGGGYIVGGVSNFDDDFSCPATSPITPGVDFDTQLADNGGPTLTHALLAGSVAADAAGTCGLATDQRGVPRDDGACDSGSFEFSPVGVGGAVSGMRALEVRCQNATTSQSIQFSLSGETSWDCEAQGLTVGSGDVVRQRVIGQAVDGAAGSVTGLERSSVICRNVTTGQSVPVPMAGDSWDCVAAGLVVSQGDRVEQRVGGGVP